MSWPPGTLRSRASGAPVRAAAYVPQSPDFSVPTRLCPPANPRESPSLSRKTTILGYPNRSGKALPDTEGGRFVDLDAALTGRVPRRSMKYRFSRNPRLGGHEQIVSGHFGRLLHSKKKQKCRRDVGEDSILAAEFRGVLCDVDEMHKIGRVRSIWRAVRVTHLLAISVIGRDETFSVDRQQLRHDPSDAFIDGLDRFDASGN